MIEPICEMCGITLSHYGAIIISPPMPTTIIVKKYHLCRKCFKFIMTIIEGER